MWHDSTAPVRMRRQHSIIHTAYLTSGYRGGGEHGQPFQRKSWPSTVPCEPLAALIIRGLDAYRGLQIEPVDLRRE